MPEIRPAARVYNNAALTIANITTTALTFNSERIDTHAIHSTSSNTSRLTAPTEDIYIITGHIQWQSNATGTRTLYIRLNGTTYISILFFANLTANSQSMTVSAVHYLAAGDYVELVVYQDSGANRDVLSGANYTPEFAMVGVSAWSGG